MDAEKGRYFMEGFLTGKHSVMKDIYEFNRPSLLSLAYGLLEDFITAQDAVAISMFKLWRNRFTMESDDHIRAFLWITVRNTCIDIMRGKYRPYIVYLGDLINWPMEEEEDCIFPDEQSELFCALMDRLSPKRKIIFEMHFLSGMERKEIGNELGLAPSTVRNTITEGLEVLRKLIPEIKAFLSK